MCSRKDICGGRELWVSSVSKVPWDPAGLFERNHWWVITVLYHVSIVSYLSFQILMSPPSLWFPFSCVDQINLGVLGCSTSDVATSVVRTEEPFSNYS